MGLWVSPLFRPLLLCGKWSENVASGNTLIPGADISDTGEKLGRGPFKVPKAPVFDGNDVSYPSWSQNFLLRARHNNLYEAFVSEAEIPIADIGFDLTRWVEKRVQCGCGASGRDALVVSV